MQASSANFAEGLSSASGMRDAGRSRRYVLLLWTGATLVSAAAAVLGFALFNGGSVERGWLEAFAAGAQIALVVETMAPEAVAGQRASPGSWQCWASRRSCSHSQAEIYRHASPARSALKFAMRFNYQRP